MKILPLPLPLPLPFSLPGFQIKGKKFHLSGCIWSLKIIAVLFASFKGCHPSNKTAGAPTLIINAINAKIVPGQVLSQGTVFPVDFNHPT